MGIWVGRCWRGGWRGGSLTGWVDDVSDQLGVWMNGWEMNGLSDTWLGGWGKATGLFLRV